MFLQDAVSCLFVKAKRYELRVTGFLQDVAGCSFDSVYIGEESGSV
jgi:hypothetical protein